VFVIPHSVASSPQRVIGGHVVAVIVGSVFSSLLLIPGLSQLAADSRYALDAIGGRVYPRGSGHTFSRTHGSEAETGEFAVIPAVFVGGFEIRGHTHASGLAGRV
jgi:hypothetical protein